PPAPNTRLLGSRLDQDILPLRVHRHLRCVLKNNVVGAGIEISKPPRLCHGVLAEHRKHASIVTALILKPRRCVVTTAAGEPQGGVGLEHWRDRRRNREPAGRVLLYPRDLSSAADAPSATVLVPPDARLSIIHHQQQFRRGTGRGSCSLEQM